MGANPQWWVLPRGATSAAVIGVGGPPVSRRADEIPLAAVLSAWCSLPARRVA
jgi:hypothetical protein